MQALPYFVFIINAIILVCLGSHILADPDAGWHLATGKWIIENQQIPFTDPFSFTAQGEDWYNMAWLWDIIFGFIDKNFGLHSTINFIAIIAALTMYFVTKTCINAKANFLGILTNILIATLVFYAAVHLRPNSVTLLFTALTFCLISSQATKKLYIYLPLIMLFWVNMHGGFIILFTILGAYWLDAVVKKDFEKIKDYTIIGLLCLITTILNPLGFEIYKAVFVTVKGPLTELITEWQSPFAANQYIFIAYVVGLLAIYRKQLQIPEAVLILFWLAMSISSVRYLPILFIVSAPFCSRAMSEIIKLSPTLIKRNMYYEIDISREKVLKLARNYSLIALILLPFLSLAINKNSKFPYQQELENIIEKYGTEFRALNYYDIGGVIIYTSQGNLKTFIDGRADTVFKPEIANDYIDIFLQKEGWEANLEKYNIELIIFPTDSALARNWDNNRKDITVVFY